MTEVKGDTMGRRAQSDAGGRTVLPYLLNPRTYPILLQSSSICKICFESFSAIALVISKTKIWKGVPRQHRA